MSIRTFARNNGLSLAMFGIFFAALIGMSVVGWRAENNSLQSHRQPAQSYTAYLASGNFVEAVFENWESEFLQMWALVMLTIFLRQKDSEDSKPLRGKIPQETTTSYSIIHAANWQKRKRAIKHTLQNWQSEFLAVGTLIVLSIKLRERSSPQSKPVGKSFDNRTGIDHSFHWLKDSPNPCPVIFETMAFDKRPERQVTITLIQGNTTFSPALSCERYCIVEQALEGHQTMVNKY